MNGVNAYVTCRLSFSGFKGDEHEITTVTTKAKGRKCTGGPTALCKCPIYWSINGKGVGTFSSGTTTLTHVLNNPTEWSGDTITSRAGVGCLGTNGHDQQNAIFEMWIDEVNYSYNYFPTIHNITNDDAIPVGKNVSFTASWADLDNDNVTLYVCGDAGCQNQLCNATASSSPANCSYTTQENDSADNDFYAFVCDDYDGSCSSPVAGSFEVIHGPFVENVSISPATAYKNSNLTGTGDYGDIHNKSQANSVLSWLVNGAVAKNETNTTTSTFSYNFTVGDNVTFSFKPCNTDGECGKIQNASATVVNAKPVIDIKEKNGYYITDDIALTANIYNLDNDPLNTSWQWQLNGNSTAENTSTLPRSYNYTRGDNITYVVNSTDGIDTASAENTITIANSPPHFISQSISPGYSNTGLSCSWVLSDIEDNTFNATAEWHKNGLEVPAWGSSVTCQNNTLCAASIAVPAENVSLGDNFTCHVAASDGIDTTESNATATIAPKCGDGIIEGNEQCEGTDFAGKSCSSYGYSQGSLSCDSCRISTSDCSNGGSGGGGGGGSSGGGGGGGGSSAPLITGDKGTTASGEKLDWPPIIDLGVATLTRDFGYKTKFITNDYSEIKTYITEKLIFNSNLSDVNYTVTIPKQFAEGVSDLSITGGNYTVAESDPVIMFHLGDIHAGDEATLNYTIATELLKYDIQSLILDMPRPTLTYALPPAPTPKPTPTATPLPTPTATPKPEKADITALLVAEFSPFVWGILLFAFAVLIYTKRGTIIEAAPKVEAPRIELPPIHKPTLPFLKEKPKQVLKPVPKLPAYPVKFPTGNRRRTEVITEIASRIQSRDGKVHAAGIWRELHNHYGDSVVRDRIYIEKWIGDWLKQNAEYTGSYRNAKYYKLGGNN